MSGLNKIVVAFFRLKIEIDCITLFVDMVARIESLVPNRLSHEALLATAGPRGMASQYVLNSYDGKALKLVLKC